MMSDKGLGYVGNSWQPAPRAASGPDMLIRQLTGGAIGSFAEMAAFGTEIGKMMESYRQALERIELTQREQTMQIAGINQRLGELIALFK